MTRPLGYALGLLVAAVLWAACPAAIGAPTLTIVAAGDTAKLYISWGAPRGATGYQLSVTVAASNGTWTGLPTALATTSTTAQVFAVSTTADSGSFTACVRSTAGAAVSTGQTCSAAKQWKRALLPPPTVSIDSAISLLVVPQGMKAYASRYAVPATTAALPFSAGSLYVTPVPGIYSSRLQFCPLVQFAGDTVGLPAAYNFPPCNFIWMDSTTWAAVTPWHAPRAGQQAVADGGCWQWTTSAGRYVKPGFWQAPGWTSAAESAAVFRPQTVTATLVDCAGAAPGTTFGRLLRTRPQLWGRVAIR